MLLLVSVTIMAFQALLIASGSIVGKLAEGAQEKQAPFNPSVITGFQEVTKFLIATVVFVVLSCNNKHGTTNHLQRPSSRSTTTTTTTVATWKYAIPALLYSVANQAMFHVLVFITPAEFVLLWNTKIIFTAALHCIILKRTLSLPRTLALLGLLVGIVMTEYTIQSNRTETEITAHLGSTTNNTGTVTDDNSTADTMFMYQFIAATATVFFALVVSLANVYTEHIYKKNTASVWEQNMMLYGFGILCNIGGILIQQSTTRRGVNGSDGSFDDVWIGLNWWCFAMILVGACSGLITGLILKYIDVLFVIIADAAAVVLNIVLSALLFGLHITVVLVVGVVIIVAAIVVYQLNGENEGNSNAIDSKDRKGMIKLSVEDDDDVEGEREEDYESGRGGKGEGREGGSDGLDEANDEDDENDKDETMFQWEGEEEEEETNPLSLDEQVSFL